MSETFHQNLSRLRREKKLSQRQAAAELGVSQALLSHYENGAREPGLAFLARACDYYGVSADYLLGRSENRETLRLRGAEAEQYLAAGLDLLNAAAALEDPEQKDNAFSLLSAFFCAMAPREGEKPGRGVLLTALLNLRRAQLGAALAEAGFDPPDPLLRRTADELTALFTND